MAVKRTPAGQENLQSQYAEFGKHVLRLLRQEMEAEALDLTIEEITIFGVRSGLITESPVLPKPFVEWRGVTYEFEGIDE